MLVQTPIETKKNIMENVKMSPIENSYSFVHNSSIKTNYIKLNEIKNCFNQNYAGNDSYPQLFNVGNKKVI